MARIVGFWYLTLQLVFFIQGDLGQAERFITTTPTLDTEATYIGQAYTNSFDSRELITAKFLGIRFAKPPVRFEMPELDTPKPDVFRALSFGPVCRQSVALVNECFRHDIQSEDCLFLNIYVPLPTFTTDQLNTFSTNESTATTYSATVTQSSLGALRDTIRERVTAASSKNMSFLPPQETFGPLVLPSNGTKFAVLIFIHGGAFIQGASNCYDGSILAGLGNIIVVTINYRLGPFGFLSTDDDVIPGNLGLWDQHVAIKWVKKHISAFGGDPGRITVGGQSAGSFSSIFQALYQGNDGLFQRVIAQSGTPAKLTFVSAMGYGTTQLVAERLNCSVTGTKLEVKVCLMEKTAEELVGWEMLSVNLVPTLDSQFITKDTYALLSQMDSSVKLDKNLLPSWFMGKDLLIGLTEHDGDVILQIRLVSVAGDNMTLIMQLMNDSANPKAFKGIIEKFLLQDMADSMADALVEAVIDRYTYWEDPDNYYTHSKRLFELFTDVFYAVPSLSTASAHSETQMYTNKSTDNSSTSPGPPADQREQSTQAHVGSGGFAAGQNGTRAKGRTYLYSFSLPVSNSSAFPWLQRTGHSADLPYVFGATKLLADESHGNLSKAMITYWSNFVKTGDSNRDEILEKEVRPPTDAKSQPPQWPEYDNQDEQYLEISLNPVPKRRMRASYRNFWSSYIPRLRLHFQDVYNSGVKSVLLRECPESQRNGQDILKMNIYVWMLLFVFFQL